MTTLLNDWLIEKLQQGDCLLFLGAGASIGSSGDKGERPPRGAELRDQLCDKYLGGKHKDKPLARVAELAKHVSSLTDVQKFIREIFLPLHPAEFHKRVTSFRWHAIITTNYDLIIERAYEEVSSRQQELCPIIRDGDNFADVLKNQNSVPFLKLHGCINTINDPNLPLILASEEYAKYRTNRTRLFDHFKDWARERPVIFVGYDISDPNVQQILFDLTANGQNRPTYAVVDPALDDIQTGYWQAHRFVAHALTFEAFLELLDQAIPPANRILASLRSTSTTSVSHWFATNTPPSNGLVRYLNEELEHVRPSVSYKGCSAREFYSGAALTWSVFVQELDQKRSASDELILQAVLDATTVKAPRTFLLKGHAGSGKSVCLRRFAWEAAKDFDAKVLLVNEGGVVRSDLIEELLELTGEPVVLIVDDAIAHAKDLNRLVADSNRRHLPLRLIICARTNEWNVATEFNFPIHDEIELKQLKESEIDGLLTKLKEHQSLGELGQMPRTEQMEHFRLHSDRQLMVALHEATTGQKFHEIAYDEYLHIQPLEARTLYLDVCTLHRLGVPVRAGLISRISDITFEKFSERFFRPLEHVVHTYFDVASRDNAYKTRHQIIAEFVFEQALPEPIERAAQITRMIRHMDTDYEPDLLAFRQLIRGRSLADLFADKALVNQIFDAAIESGAAEDFVSHQRAIFELHHRNGDHRAAYHYILKAEQLSESKDRSILHTKASIMRHLAIKTGHALEKHKYRSDAKVILERLRSSNTHSHAFDTYGRLLLDEIQEFLMTVTQEPSELSDRTLSDLIRNLEQTISAGLQRFPGDEHLLTLDADLAKTLDNEPRAFASLKSAGAANPGRPFIAIRLASAMKSKGQIVEAKQVLRQCLELNPSSKECHYHLAMILMEEDEFANRQQIEHHLRRSFTEGDTNFDAQLWYGRQELLFGDLRKGLDTFARLGSARVMPVFKNKIRGLVRDQQGQINSYVGSVRSLQNAFCFVSVPELRFDVFLKANSFDGNWEQLEVGAKIKMNVGFNLKGAAADLACQVK